MSAETTQWCGLQQIARFHLSNSGAEQSDEAGRLIAARSCAYLGALEEPLSNRPRLVCATFELVIVIRVRVGRRKIILTHTLGEIGTV